MFKKVLLVVLVLCSNSYIYGSTQKYTISVCATSNLENALTCKKRILKNMQSDVFIIKDREGRYLTYLGFFDNKNEAKYLMNTSSQYVKKQKPYVKLLSNEIVLHKDSEKAFIDLNNLVTQEKVKYEPIPEVIKKNDEVQLKFVQVYPFPEGYILKDEKVQEKNEILPTSEEKQIVTQKEIDKLPEKVEPIVSIVPDEIVDIKKNEKSESQLSISDYEQILIEVDSKTNSMVVKAKIDNEFKDIKTYKVSTGKNEIKRPLGKGNITQISLNPIWYPTADTIKSFKKRGIYLPSVVPSGHKYNYMGAAKINLTHIVDGKNTFRIHGTLNEKTIGTNESAGCIRMKNNEVVQLASMLNKFASLKSLDYVKVILK
jgi:L,D-transpeptidase YcfS